MNDPDPTNPTDTALADVVGNLDAEGFDGQFRSVDGGQVQCLTCRTSFDASTLSGDQVTRLEGASDPADMVMVVPVSCSTCATEGTLVLSYGPDASVEDADVIRLLSRRPGRSASAIDDRPGATPGMTGTGDGAAG